MFWIYTGLSFSEATHSLGPKYVNIQIIKNVLILPGSLMRAELETVTDDMLLVSSAGP